MVRAILLSSLLFYGYVGASLDWEYKASDSTVKEFVQKSNKIGT